MPDVLMEILADVLIDRRAAAVRIIVIADSRDKIRVPSLDLFRDARFVIVVPPVVPDAGAARVVGEEARGGDAILLARRRVPEKRDRRRPRAVEILQAK